MATYLEKSKELMGTFPVASVEVILRSKNSNTDALAKLASTRDVVSVEFLVEPSIGRQPEIIEMTQEPLWMDPIITYLRNDELHEGKIEAHILRLKAATYSTMVSCIGEAIKCCL